MKNFKKNKDNENKINKINEDIKLMNEFCKEETNKIKSDFIILNEKLNLSAENENTCINETNEILKILEQFLVNSNKIKLFRWSN